MRILVVDDNKQNLYLLEQLLRGNGYEVVSAGDGVEALAKLASENINVIVADILMPKMDGFQLCRQVKASDRWKVIPFIFYTATYTDAKDEEFALSLGADRFVIKPEEPEVFAGIIKEVIGNSPARALPAGRPRLEEESEYMKLYNQRLIRKLEDKMSQLETTARELARRENRLRQVIETEPECVKILAVDGSILEMNPSGLRMLEAASMKQIAGMKFSAFVAPEHHEALIGLNERVLSGETGFLEFEMVGLKGTRRWMETHRTPLKDADGKINGLLGIARDITERKRGEQRLRASQEQLRALARYLETVREEERTRIARELHDEIGQALTAIKLSLEANIRGQGDHATPGLGQALRLSNELIERVRNLSLDLRPAMLDDLGLLPALTWHFDRYQSQVNIRVDFKHSGIERRRFAPEIETAVYRIVQEALTNVARHANVDRVEVEVQAGEDALCVRTKDQGAGFFPDSLTAITGGLSGMRERAIMLGGQLEVVSSPGAGTELVAHLPIRSRYANDQQFAAEHWRRREKSEEHR
jgi:PAS domain S-box-containing protein